jgi:2-C-methyl-D-erythritol 2,4-cyclodiphosphate synthase
METRIGLGFDLHRLVPERKLVLGGVEVPFERGLLGHSDGDALVHAICDALLGAAGLGDRGTHFPNDDPQYEGIPSLLLLARVKALLDQQSYQIANIDATVIAERPKLTPYFPKMIEKLAQTLKIGPEQINLKATRPEGLGSLGRGEGIAAQAITLIQSTKPSL